MGGPPAGPGSAMPPVDPEGVEGVEGLAVETWVFSAAWTTASGLISAKKAAIRITGRAISHWICVSKHSGCDRWLGNEQRIGLQRRLNSA